MHVMDAAVIIHAAIERSIQIDRVPRVVYNAKPAFMHIGFYGVPRRIDSRIKSVDIIGYHFVDRSAVVADDAIASGPVNEQRRDVKLSAIVEEKSYVVRQA